MNSMQKPPHDEPELEQYIGRILRAQPPRPAPAGLEARVLQQLALGAARPWWLQGFSRWPWLARILFVLVSAGLVLLTYFTTDQLGSLSQGLQQTPPANAVRAGAQAFTNFGQSLQALGEMITRNIPTAWLYGGAGVALLLYAALFGLGAVAFRTLIDTTPEHARY
jgi:hypothetical protein